MDFGIQVDKDLAVALRFEKFPDDARARIVMTMRSLEQRLEVAVRAAEPERTGQLRSLTGGRVYEHDDRIAAVVGVRATSGADARKAGALEWGSKSSFAVRAHQMKLDHIYARAVAPISVAVSESTRRTNLDPRRYLRDTIDRFRGLALDELRQAVSAAAQAST